MCVCFELIIIKLVSQITKQNLVNQIVYETTNFIVYKEENNQISQIQ